MKIVIKIRREPSGKFRAWCPSLPGCAVFGETADDVRHKMDHALRAYLCSLNAAVPGRLVQDVVRVS